MRPTHVMSFGGDNCIVQSITLCGVEPGHVEQVTVRIGELELVSVLTFNDDDGHAIPAGLALARRAAMEGRAGMRLDLSELRGGITQRDGLAPLVLSAWLAPGRPPGARLQVVVTYWPHRETTAH